MKKVKHVNHKLLKKKKNYCYMQKIYKFVQEMLNDSKEIVLVSNKN